MRTCLYLGYHVLLLPALVAGCASGSGETSHPAPGSPAWYETASQQSIAEYLRARCVNYGYMLGTSEMAECIRKEASAAGQTNIAHTATMAGATVRSRY